uniref:Suppressor of G2 allele of SKP1 n=1 Tax=Timema monikensis TaxID=170555 RepID=A0A7R9E827_9NEOP|nr:unnamed protein product [Timema monikensis]
MAEAQLSGDTIPENNQLAEIPKIKYDWYQTETHVVISILGKNVLQDSVNINYDCNTLNLRAHFPQCPDYSLILNLAHPIEPSQCTHRAVPSKVEIKLKKCDGIRWTQLERKLDEPAPVANFSMAQVPVDSGPPKYPSSAPHAKDWNRVVLEEGEDKEEGEAALNSLFQKIYLEGTDEVKRAMNKSFQESGGTVLSTNWKEVGHDKVDIKAPDGMEWRNWEQ